MKSRSLMITMPTLAILLLPAEEGLALAAVAVGAAGLVLANVSLLVLPGVLLRYATSWFEKMGTAALAALLAGVAGLILF